VRVPRDERTGEFPLKVNDLAPVSLEVAHRAAPAQAFALA
jgi:hypothetical protein